MNFLTLLLIFTLTIFFIYFKSILKFWRNIKAFSYLPKFPVPSYPVIGQVLSLPADSTGYFKTLEKLCFKLVEEKNKMGVLWVGVIPNLFLFHPSSTELFFKGTKNLEKSYDYKILIPWVKYGLATSSGKKWQQRRKLITPTFHYDILKDFLQVMNEQTTIMIDKIDSLVSSNENVNISKHLKLCALDIICETAMGHQVNAQLDEENEYVKAVGR